MPKHLAKLTADELKLLDRDKTVFFIPVAPLEDHGPHLPLGLDLHEAERLCALTAERLENELSGWVGVILPTLPAGLDSDTAQVRFTVRGYVLRDWLVDTCRTFIAMGFRRFACFSGQLGPRQLTAIEEAGWILRGPPHRALWAKFFKKKTAVTFVSACSPLVSAGEVWASPLWPDPAEHGGRIDTSVALYLCPDLVKPEYANLPDRPRAGTPSSRAWDRWVGRIAGYWGQPARASAADGAAALKTRVEEVYPKLRAVWDGAKPENLFRSWYSIFPPNRSFFKAWLLALMVALLMVAWVYLSFRQLTEGFF